MITSIYFVHRFHFNKQYYIQDNFEALKKAGYEVKYIDITAIIKSKYLEDTCPENLKNEVIYFHRPKDFRSFLKQHRNSCMIISDIGFQSNSAWYFRLLSKYNIPYCSTDSKFPVIRKQTKIIQAKHSIQLIIKRFSPVKLIKKPLQFIDYQYTKLILKPAVALFVYRSKIRKRLKTVCGTKTKIIYSNSIDWNLAMADKTPRMIQDKYVVFIDQYIPYHPDLVAQHVSISAEEYYQTLNLFFHEVERITGYRVVIAAHPRRMLTHGESFQFEMVYNQTASLVKYSEAVLLHYSTAFNYAIIFSKPMIILNADLFKPHHLNYSIENIAACFKSAIINISTATSTDIQDAFQTPVDAKSYQVYKNENLQHPLANGELIHEQLLNLIDLYNKTILNNETI